MAVDRICDFCEILACWRWVWWGVGQNSLKLRITIQAVMHKARGIDPKTQRSFVDCNESSVGDSVWWAWPQPFASRIDLKCCKFLARLWWLPSGLERFSHPLHQHHHLDQPLG